jgi:acetyl-CoA carboxylase carboxyltransferase component
VRERIDQLVDPGSFHEYGGLAGEVELDAEGRCAREVVPASVVMGVARLGGRPALVCGDDFTLRGAAYSAASLRKAQLAEELAVRRRIPLVRLLEGGGASVAGTGGARGRSGYDFVAPPALALLCVDALAQVPVVSAALGPVAGFQAARLVASHFSVMTRSTAQVLIGGPALVERALGEKRSKEELGGADVHLRSGVVDNGAEDESDALAQIRSFLSYLPPNVWEAPPVQPCDDPPERAEEELLSIVPRARRRAYRVRRVIAGVVDRGSFFEIAPLFARSQVTGLARLAGHPVGVLANDCFHDGGAMTAEAAQKVRRFVERCDAFGLPILSFVDEPGFAIGSEAERAGTIRHGMAAMFAAMQSRVPWAAIILRRCFGVAAGIHLGPACTAFAWPSAQSGSMPVEAGVELAFGREIASAPDPEARRRELEEEIAAAQSILPRAAEFGVHDVIDPRSTRPRLCAWLEEVAEQLRAPRGPRAYSLRP